MKKYFYILAALSLASTHALAQSLEKDVDVELDQLYSNQKAAQTEASAVSGAVTQKAQGAIQTKAETPNSAAGRTQQPVSVSGSQPIYILNQAPSNSSAQVQQAQVQKQPTTVIEASPLTESRAEQIRKTRQDVEVQTEQKIVEKLEQSRMDDEKKRANVLFGDKFNQLNNQQQEVAPQPVQQAPVQPVQRVEEPKENVRDIVHEELKSAMKAEETAVSAPTEMKYISGMVGMADLPDVRNVKSNYSLGVAYGSKNETFTLEGAFLFSNYTVDQGAALYNYSAGYYPMNVNVNQYSGQLIGKVQVLSGFIRPVFGALASYSYRNFMWNNGYSGYVYNSVTSSSHALDVGALAGVDFEFSNKYSLGLDFKYLWNVASQLGSNNNNNMFINSPMYGTPIEKLQYYVMSVVGRVSF